MYIMVASWAVNHSIEKSCDQGPTAATVNTCKLVVTSPSKKLTHYESTIT